MTIRLLLDQIVPEKTSFIKNATNKKVPIVDHVIGGYAVYLFYGKRIVNFLGNLKK